MRFSEDIALVCGDDQLESSAYGDTALPREVAGNLIIHVCHGAVDLGPSQHRGFPSVPPLVPQPLHVGRKGIQHVESVGGDDLQPRKLQRLADSPVNVGPPLQLLADRLCCDAPVALDQHRESVELIRPGEVVER